MAKMNQSGYNKLSLSERFNPEAYMVFIAENPVWCEFYYYVKSVDFVNEVGNVLWDNGIRLPAGKYKSRFEFSAMPVAGGTIAPHRDIASKVVTLVISMVDKWNNGFGGATDILKPKYQDKEYDDYKNAFSDFDIVYSYQFNPNQCVVFVKTDNSWHAVAPMIGSTDEYRKSVTINIERVS